jgi:hypothetical protein
MAQGGMHQTASARSGHLHQRQSLNAPCCHVQGLLLLAAGALLALGALWKAVPVAEQVYTSTLIGVDTDTATDDDSLGSPVALTDAGYEEHLPGSTSPNVHLVAYSDKINRGACCLLASAAHVEWTPKLTANFTIDDDLKARIHKGTQYNPSVALVRSRLAPVVAAVAMSGL